MIITEWILIHLSFLPSNHQYLEQRGSLHQKFSLFLSQFSDVPHFQHCHPCLPPLTMHISRSYAPPIVCNRSFSYYLFSFSLVGTHLSIFSLQCIHVHFIVGDFINSLDSKDTLFSIMISMICYPLCTHP
jgi:hypothetical protein